MLKTPFVSFGILVLTFVVSFLVTTAICDGLDRLTGYYNQGIQESKEVYE